MAIETQTAITVRYAETDAQGVAHHASYLVWLEEARSDFLRQCDLRYSDWEKSGFFVVVAEAQLRYKAPVYYEDVITVETRLERLKPRFFEFGYSIRNQNKKLVAEGQTLHFVLNRQRQIAALPQELLGHLEAMA